MRAGNGRVRAMSADRRNGDLVPGLPQSRESSARIGMRILRLRRIAGVIDDNNIAVISHGVWEQLESHFGRQAQLLQRFS